MTLQEPTVAETLPPLNLRGEAPPYVVFPALVIGIGTHGKRVCAMLKDRLKEEDARLLQIVCLATLAPEGEQGEWHGIGERTNTDVAFTKSLESLHVWLKS